MDKSEARSTDDAERAARSQRWLPRAEESKSKPPGSAPTIGAAQRASWRRYGGPCDLKISIEGIELPRSAISRCEWQARTGLESPAGIRLSGQDSPRRRLGTRRDQVGSAAPALWAQISHQAGLLAKRTHNCDTFHCAVTAHAFRIGCRWHYVHAHSIGECTLTRCPISVTAASHPQIVPRAGGRGSGRFAPPQGRPGTASWTSRRPGAPQASRLITRHP